MNNKHRKTLKSIFAKPVPSNLKWKDIEKLFINLGAKISEGHGSRVRIELFGLDMVFHRPHPKPDTDKGSVISVRQFLILVGINENEI